MPYATTHLYLTFHWLSVGTEQGQVGLRMSTSLMPSGAQLSAMSTAFNNFWVNPTTDIASNFRYYRMKAALIAPDGKYPPGHIPEVVDQAPAPGVEGFNLFPLQVAWVTSLEGSFPRSPAGRGRIYLPPPNGALDGNGTGVAIGSAVTARMNAVRGLIVALNAVGAGTVSILSTKGTGYAQTVQRVRQGNRLDVQRRRAAQQPETYSSVTV